MLSGGIRSNCYDSGMADLRPMNRVHNLKLLLRRFGSQSVLAEMLKCTPGYISQLLNGTRPFTEKTARKFERTLKIPHESLDGFVVGPYAVEGPATTDAKTRAGNYEDVPPVIGKNTRRLIESFQRLTPVVQAHVLAIAEALAMPSSPTYLKWETEQRRKNHERDNNKPHKRPGAAFPARGKKGADSDEE